MKKRTLNVDFIKNCSLIFEIKKMFKEKVIEDLLVIYFFYELQ